MFERIMNNFAMHIALDDDEAAFVQSILQHKKAKRHSALLRSGDVCRALYFVNQGCLRIFKSGDDGKEHILSFSPENWWATDLTSFTKQKPAFYSIDAVEDSDLFYIGYEALEKLYARVPKFERFFRILTQNGFSLYQQRVTRNLSKPAEERYALFQKSYPGLEQRITQKHIAAYLGITPVFLSKIRKRKFG